MRQFFATLLLFLFLPGAFAQTTKKTDHRPATSKTEANPATPAAGGTNLPSEATVNAFLQHMFGYDAEIKWQIMAIKPSPAAGMAEIDVVLSNPQGQQSQKLFLTPDHKFAFAGDMIPFGANPFAANQALLQKAKGPAQGPANATLTIVEFGDLQCPSCKAAQPTIEKLIADVPNSRLVFEQFPLTQIHNWAMKAAAYGSCVAQQNNDAYFKFMKNVYQQQEQITAENADEKLKTAATAAGVNADAVAKCAALPATATGIQQSTELGKALDVTGTPTLFLNGRKIGNVNQLPYDVLKGIAEYQAKQK